MARGQKYNDDIREKARALLSVDNNVASVAKQLGLPRSTIQSWKESFERESEQGTDEFVKLRHEKKETFVKNAWENIEKAQQILSDKLNKALEDCDTVGVKELAVVIGTLFDKQALASDEATQNVGGSVAMKWEDFA